jgi:antirestriction protein ArdC
MTKNHTPNQLALGLTTPVLSTAQRDARPDRQARLDAAHAVLARGLSGVRDDPKVLAAYLAFRARFHDYSPRNTLLIWMQRPTAKYCMGFRSWTKHGRRVRKGERGITVLAPILRRPSEGEVAAGHDPDDRVPAGFRTATTFDYEQTEAVTDDALVYVPPITRLDADGPDGLLARLEAAARSIGCSVYYTSLGYADGWYREADRTVCVRASLSGADRCSVLCHELAHVVAHTGDRETPRASKEVQAEGAAYVALAALGLDTARASLPYLKGWGDDERLADELEAIDRIVRQILAVVDASPRQ